MATGLLSRRTGADGLQDYTAESNTANPNGEDRTGFFPISPGKKTVVVRLPEEGYDMNHFYLHVDAQPLTRNVDFTGRPGPAGPSFLVHSVCYAKQEADGGKGWSCIHPDGAGAGALKERPATYVPFLTAKYDEDATAAKKKTAGSAKLEPVYQWS
jgi:hypothetical protein